MNDYLMILAILLAPLIAIRVEKFLEKERSGKERRLSIFKTLMATRARTLDPSHVEALNMIDLEFAGEKGVTNAWKEYLDHLGATPQQPTIKGKTKAVRQSEKSEYDAVMATWSSQKDTYLTNLLFVMGKALNYNFDKTHIKRAIYSPKGHEDYENEQRNLRLLMIALLAGEIPLKIEDASHDKKGLAEQGEIRQSLIRYLKGEVVTPIKVVEDNHD